MWVLDLYVHQSGQMGVFRITDEVRIINIALAYTKKLTFFAVGNLRVRARMGIICGSMEIKNITKAYDGKAVLENLNIRIKEGAATCIMAPSGAGKTTLLRILMGLERADSGTVMGLEGRKISAVFQEERLCETLTAVENIRLVTPRLEPHAVRKELERLGLLTDSSQPVSELSGGMRRRVSILRALLAEYEVLFLDEPFTGLDHDLKVQVMAYVREKTVGKTVVFVTHDRQEAVALGAEVVELVG